MLVPDETAIVYGGTSGGVACMKVACEANDGAIGRIFGQRMLCMIIL